MRFINYLFASLILSSLLGCPNSAHLNNTVQKRYAHFGVGELSDDWQRTRFRGSDLFFEHTSRDAAIFFSSQCEKFSDSPLPALTSQMLVGMGDYQVVSQKAIDVSGRQALISEVNTKLDGVYRYLKIMVLRKNRCVFDAVLSAKVYDSNVVKDFDKLISSFWAEADL